MSELTPFQPNYDMDSYAREQLPAAGVIKSPLPRFGGEGTWGTFGCPFFIFGFNISCPHAQQLPSKDQKLRRLFQPRSANAWKRKMGYHQTHR